MLPLESVHELYRQMEWADAATWRAAISLSGSESSAEFIDRLYHMHATQRLFLQLWMGEKRDSYDPKRFASLADLREWSKTYYPAAKAFLSTVRSEQLNVPILVPWARLFEPQLGSPASSTTLGETIMQVWAHTTAHRAQVATRLRQLGVEPPFNDFIGWIWAGRPAPNW